MVNTGEASLQVLASLSLDRAAAAPLHLQVARHLERAIDAGELAPGTLLLNEIDLADALDLSRPTVRRAIQTLVDDGRVVRRRGIGTRVVQPMLRRPLELTSLYDDLVRSGKKPSTRVLSLERVAADALVAERLGVRRGSQVVRAVRLRRAGRKPIAKMTNHLPERFADLSAADLAARGLYDLLRARGVTLHSAVQTMGAASADADDAALLAEPPGGALLTTQRTTYDDHGRAVEFGTHLYAASRYSVEISLLVR